MTASVEELYTSTIICNQFSPKRFENLVRLQIYRHLRLQVSPQWDLEQAMPWNTRLDQLIILFKNYYELNIYAKTPQV
jgi:hypothetical protein